MRSPHSVSCTGAFDPDPCRLESTETLTLRPPRALVSLNPLFTKSGEDLVFVSVCWRRGKEQNVHRQTVGITGYKAGRKEYERRFNNE